MKKYFNVSLKSLAILFALGIIAAGVTSWLLITIAYHKAEEKSAYEGIVKPLSDKDVSPEAWGVNFPFHYQSYLKMGEKMPATYFAGGEPYSKLIRYPALTELWAGYPFSADYNTKRSHVFSQVDQMETKRNDKEWLNSHGFPAFKGQPGACMNCHSGHVPELIKSMGWLEFNKTPYTEIKAGLMKKYGDGMHQGALGSTCADCHTPKDMSLRITRPAYINAMVIRGYKADPETGIKATPQEMRSHVCQQCHVEYYFKKGSNELTFPWANWPKDTPFRIEMFDKYYENIIEEFPQDWQHKVTGAAMLKMQHPETELTSSGIHAQNGVACADCHMPFIREGARKFTDHNIRSPLFNINASCQTCHNIPENKLKERVENIQMQTASTLRNTEGVILALIQDIDTAKKMLLNNDTFTKNKTKEQIESEINKVLKNARQAHRQANMRWDFIFSENSTGFHSPAEAQRVLGQAMQIARSGQISLINDLNQVGIHMKMTDLFGKVPQAPAPIPERHKPVGDPPSESVISVDQKVKELNKY